MISRRQLLTGTLGATAGGVTAVALGLPESLGLRQEDRIKNRFSELHKLFSNPGVTISLHTKHTTDDEGKSDLYYTTSVDIELDAEKSPAPRVRSDLSDITKITDTDKTNIDLLSKAVAGPYTLVALVGSTANQELDRLPNDIDILVLNGKDSAYSSPNQLFDNQSANVYNIFRAALGYEVIEQLKITDPKKATLIEEDMALRKKGMPGVFYSPALATQFLVRGSFSEPGIGLPIHLLGPKDGKLENVAYSLVRLQKALRENKATIIYQGAKNNLI